MIGLIFISGLLLVQCTEEQPIEVTTELDVKPTRKTDDDGSGGPIYYRQTIRKSNYPGYLNGKTVNVDPNTYVRYNQALFSGLQAAVFELNNIPNFGVSFEINRFSQSTHVIGVIDRTFPITTCWGEVSDPIEGNASGSTSEVAVGRDVQYEHPLLIKSLFVHEIMHILGFKHPNELGVSSCWSTQKDGVMEPCLCPNGNPDPECLNHYLNPCERTTLVGMYPD